MRNTENFSFNFTPNNLDISSNSLSASFAFTPYRSALMMLFLITLVSYYFFLQGSITKLPYNGTTNFIFILVLLYFFLLLLTPPE